MLGFFGVKHHRSINVYQYSKKGEYLNSFGSIKEAYRITGVNSSDISICCKGKRKSAGGYKWSYSII